MKTKVRSIRLTEETLKQIKYKAWLEDLTLGQLIDKAISSYQPHAKYAADFKVLNENFFTKSFKT